MSLPTSLLPPKNPHAQEHRFDVQYACLRSQRLSTPERIDPYWRVKDFYISHVLDVWEELAIDIVTLVLSQLTPSRARGGISSHS